MADDVKAKAEAVKESVNDVQVAVNDLIGDGQALAAELIETVQTRLQELKKKVDALF